MPDRDVVHSGVSHFFQHAYRLLCEGMLPKEELVRNTLEALTRSVRSYGDEPIKFLQAWGEQLGELPDEPLLREAIDWHKQDRWINGRAQQFAGKKRAVALAAQRAKISLQELRRGGNKQDIQGRLLRGYLSDIYEADFVERVPLVNSNGGVDQHVVEERIHSIEASINDGIDKLAKQLAQKSTVTAIRTPRRPHPKERITLDTDLLKPNGLDGKDA